ncbi:MAG: site-specific DNA-methyltransferase, partial [Muribaculaceae bacterium]
TTGIASSLCGRRFLGIEKEEIFASISRERRKELDDIHVRQCYRNKLSDLSLARDADTLNDPMSDYFAELPF